MKLQGNQFCRWNLMKWKATDVWLGYVSLILCLIKASTSMTCQRSSEHDSGHPVNTFIGLRYNIHGTGFLHVIWSSASSYSELSRLLQPSPSIFAQVDSKCVNAFDLICTERSHFKDFETTW